MPVRHFDMFIAERCLSQTSAVSQLKDTRLGIDGNTWIRKILTKEPAVVAMGGTPLSLRNAIEKELSNFKSQNIQPIFVFPGLTTTREEPFSTKDTRPGNRSAGWDNYDKGKIELAYASWAGSGAVNVGDIQNIVFRTLHQHNVEFVRAPYWAWAQLAYMYTHPNQIVNAVYGGSELLMWEVDRVITDVDFAKGSYTWVKKDAILDVLKINKEQFLDICILSGFEYCPSFHLPNVAQGGFASKGTHDLVRKWKSGLLAVQMHADDAHTNKYVDMFCRMRCAVKHHVVINDAGHAVPLNADDAPSDIHAIIGYRLPDELYFYLMHGLIGPQLINNLVSGALIENYPPDNGETAEYRDVLSALLAMRTQTLSLLTQPLHPFFQQRKVNCYFYFAPKDSIPLEHHPKCSGDGVTSLNNVYEQTISWNVRKPFLEREKKQQNASVIDVAFCMRAMDNAKNAEESLASPKNGEPFKDKDEIIANVLWKFLDIRYLLTSKHIPTDWGQALVEALKSVSDREPYIPETLLTAFELIRFGILTARPYSKTYSKTQGDDDQKSHITLLSRTFSLLPMALKNEPWSDKLNRDLLVFNSAVKALTRSYRNLCEMLTLSLFMNRLVDRACNDYFGIANSLPYLSDNNVALGLVTKHYLEQSLNGDVAAALRSTESEFSTCDSPKADLQRAFRFWEALMTGLDVLKKNGTVSSETYTMFSEANNWLQSRRI